MTYFDTTKEKEKLGDYRKQSNRQEVLIANIFSSHKYLSPSQVARIYNLFHDPVPLTSIRRAITVLTNKKILYNTGDKVVGIYGRKEYVWGLTVWGGVNQTEVKKNDE